jgi:hypothetical protein
MAKLKAKVIDGIGYKNIFFLIKKAPKILLN